MVDSAPPSVLPSVGPGEILPFAAARNPHKVALVVGTTRLTYHDLNSFSDLVAKALAARGIGPGDVVSLFGQNSWQWIVTYHGALKAGAVVNPVNVMLTSPELAYVLADCNAKALFVGPERMDAAVPAVAEVEGLTLLCSLGDSDGLAGISFDEFVSEAAQTSTPVGASAPLDLCSIGYTSGTTGHPKGAMLSQQSVLLNCALTATMHGRSERDVIVTALPCAHVYGNVAINGTFLAGGTVVLMDRFDAANALHLIETEHATLFEGVPAMYSMILSDPAIDTTDLSSLRISTVGGQTFSTEVIARWQARTGVPLIELWGMTEIAGLGTTHSLYAPQVPGSIGVALPGIDVKIGPLEGSVDDVPIGEPGELMIRGPLVMLGYYGRPDATAEVLGTDGWLRTGDVAYIDDTGHFFVVDRLKDMIVTAGYNVYPAEIERVVGAHPGVAMVAVGRRADPVKGEIAIAYVVPAPGVDLDVSDVLTYCGDRLAAYKRPRDVILVDSLPTTSSGKLMRRKLADIDPVPGQAPATSSR
ncbi:fatty-acid--CoA ligase [Rhodococcus sp. ACS1]|uniref:class I adenylate-forming enzyme family protein n=1 Tax=Rhodococcus sp. ACS1 TaxID=2028570 RepID=UPI000BB16104|nr:AMP-binding protein [Rhodococcus sp. ACS1]PBC35079.1 fatty-acid--CoA ligase [Rhodococcus sp. ACS1]